MPRGTPVDRCFQKLKGSKGEASAARICQASTGTALATGKPPKGKASDRSMKGHSHAKRYG